jgi:hypothetical protein
MTFSKIYKMMETATFFSVLSRHNDILLCSFAVTNQNTKRPTQTTTTTMMAPSIERQSFDNGTTPPSVVLSNRDVVSHTQLKMHTK